MKLTKKALKQVKPRKASTKKKEIWPEPFVNYLDATSAVFLDEKYIK